MKSAFELLNRDQMRKDRHADALFIGSRLALGALGGLILGVLISVDPTGYLAGIAAQ